MNFSSCLMYDDHYANRITWSKYFFMTKNLKKNQNCVFFKNTKFWITTFNVMISLQKISGEHHRKWIWVHSSNCKINVNYYLHKTKYKYFRTLAVTWHMDLFFWNSVVTRDPWLCFEMTLWPIKLKFNYLSSESPRLPVLAKLRLHANATYDVMN